jgi:hypothetical protein
MSPSEQNPAQILKRRPITVPLKRGSTLTRQYPAERPLVNTLSVSVPDTGCGDLPLMRSVGSSAMSRSSRPLAQALRTLRAQPRAHRARERHGVAKPQVNNLRQGE